MHFLSSASETTHQETEEGGRTEREISQNLSADPLPVTFVPVALGWETQLTDRRGKRRKRSIFLSGFSMATVLSVGAATFQFLLYNLAVRWTGGGGR